MKFQGEGAWNAELESERISEHIHPLKVRLDSIQELYQH